MRSLLEARIPPTLTTRIIIVNNNSTDGTAEVISRLTAEAPGRVIGLREHRQGRSAALNAGIRASDADLIGFIDDDERVSEGWFQAIADTMQAPGVDFIGGPCLGDWEIEPPPWLPEGYPAVLGVVDGGPDRRPFGPEYPGILMGGNCVLRCSLFDRVGLYSTGLGRTASGLLSGEDHDMYLRLLAAGAKGVYVPTLRIHHFIPRTRVTRHYYRSWCLWHGISRGRWLREHREPVPQLLGIPRYHFGATLRGLGSLARRSPGERFAGELEIWNLMGLLYGRHLARSPRHAG